MISIFCFDITWSRRSVLNYKLLVLSFLRLMTCSMNTKQKICEQKIFQLQSMSNARICAESRPITICGRKVGVSFLTSTFDYSNPKWKSSTRRIGSSLQVSFNDTWTVFCDTLIPTCGTVIRFKWTWWSAAGDRGSNPAGCSHLAIFHGTELVSGRTHAPLYCSTVSAHYNF